MAISALIAFGLPVGTYIVLKKSKGVRMVPAVLGAATFVVAALALNGAIDFFVFKNAGDFFDKNKMMYVLYVSLISGLLNQSGVFLAFRVMRKKFNAISDAYSFGVGFGGIQAIYFVGFTMISNIVMAQMVNESGVASIVSTIAAAQQSTVAAGLNALVATPSLDHLLSGVDIIGRFPFYMGALLLTYLAASKRGPFWLFPLAIVIHMVFNIPAALSQAGLWNDLWLIRVCNVVLGVLVLWLGVRMVRKAERELPGANAA
jgi:uncharacterized membrane protein YhfC